MSVVIVPTGGGTVSGIIQIGKPVNDLPNYGEGKDIIAMYGGSPCAMDPMGCLLYSSMRLEWSLLRWPGKNQS